MAQARDLKQKEQQRKAEMFGAENVYRTQRAKGVSPEDVRPETQRAASLWLGGWWRTC